MSDPLNNKEFKHFLNFINSGLGRIEISEPVKFDASEFVIEQDGYARDVSFMNEEINLEFHKGIYEKTDTPQTLPDGTIIYNLTMGFEWLIEELKEDGFELNVEYILERNNLEFITGNLNGQESETDEFSYISMKVVQNTKKAIVKRRENIKVDVFSDEDLDGNTITPLSTTNILLKAKPTVQKSEWTLPQEYNVGFPNAGNTWFNFINNVTSSGIENTLSFIQGFNDFDNKDDFIYITAVNDLSNGIIDLKDVEITIGNNITAPITIDFNVFYYIGENFDYPNRVLLYNDYRDLPTGEDATFIVNETLADVIIPNGHSFWLWYQPIISRLTQMDFKSGSLNAEFTSTAIDSVIKGVRYKDLIAQTLKSVNGQDLVAPIFDTDGEYEYLFATNGNLIRQIEGKELYTKFKDRKENLVIINGDLQINNDNGFVGKYDDFYANVDNGGFLLSPNDKFKSSFDEKYTINESELIFKNYEKDRDEENTLDSVHTETQLLTPNKQVQNKKPIKISDIFDPFLIESQRRLALKETTALDSDDKVFAIDCVPLSPSATGNYSIPLTHNVNNDSQLQLLNNTTFKWGLLGFDVADEFVITNTTNADSYIIVEITNNVLTLQPQSITPTSIGLIVTSISYAYTNVAYTNRTNEGFDLIENISSPDKFSNLRFTPRRILKHWESYLNTTCKFTSGVIKNTYFKNNGDLVTQFEGGEVYAEGADIQISSLEEKILSPKLYTQEIIVEYDDVLALIQKYQEIDTLGGFIRVQDTKGAIIKVYPKTLKYVWVTKVMTVVGNQRNESDFVEITSSSGLITINEVGYDLDILPEVFYSATGDYIVLYDENEINLINLTKFDKVRVNGSEFATIEDLAQAIINL